MGMALVSNKQSLCEEGAPIPSLLIDLPGTNGAPDDKLFDELQDIMERVRDNELKPSEEPL